MVQPSGSPLRSASIVCAEYPALQRRQHSHAPADLALETITLHDTCTAGALNAYKPHFDIAGRAAWPRDRKVARGIGTGWADQDLAPCFNRRERDRSLGHRRLQAEPWPVMRASCALSVRLARKIETLALVVANQGLKLLGMFGEL